MTFATYLGTAARVLAQLRGKAAVKDSIRRQGFKASSLRPAEINEWARLYVIDHPQLVEQVIEDARQMILAGVLGKRAAKALRAKLESHPQNQTPQNSMASVVQISGAK